MARQELDCIFIKELSNLTLQRELKKHLLEDTEPRTTVSFYRYHNIENPLIVIEAPRCPDTGRLNEATAARKPVL